ncbi:flavin oxidoreductase [Rhodovulum sulfidophilum]|uniref:Flavin reductase (DIM6/NTAB) family NADH-FMN oxidoreductase RutF n=1 Tax=Rhodovulum visakhapatnamense TaxID=364297 RepID=A0A4V3GTW0_9RHOB|nr:flavin reductase family protein [Rhodovulum visakhapatnamense]MBL3569718.1 flavin reductase family protein [Rhodovulum visakhapatnamense]MBL3579953.1 flavin reductase family protein [Rhodovulum visakhapatnamense]OLS44575.1 flavin oxidoreductase [Rhodovulum sulfidophilum]TDX28500.1 flavin reductase (DIM6/NTAB) family NADH-FMN oxidoreductase RutF [Rhodovulum visakhapatnamense]
MERFIPGPDTQRLYRDALGSFATGVTVVTALGSHGPVGMTANSFSSVSLDPPLVLWSPARASTRYPAMSGAERFAIHVLGAGEENLAARFARSGADFEGLGPESGDDPPLLEQGWIARFVCRRVALHEAGDHAIVVGHVEDCARREGPPLVFAGGAYGDFSPLG